VDRLLSRRGDHNLVLNTNKTKELRVEYRRNRSDIQPLFINGDRVEQVGSFKFLGVTLKEDLTWDAHIAALVKRAQQRLDYLRLLRKQQLNEKLRSFDTFINKVPPKDWKRFMRLLKLTDNEIDSAEKSSQYGNEQHYQMLRTWLDKNGQAATLSVLLDVLSSMDLKGIAEEVTSALISQHFYVYEE
uniref:Death domain-containing protein n=1 Tax=Pseudonaja textilis TaxID=8673 RepID=A0A670YQE6_PSETE